MDDFPDIPRPLARGAHRCHILALQDYVGTMVAACGTSCGPFCGDESYHDGLEACPFHGFGLCPDCTRIMEHLSATGEWKGVVGDPETFGVIHEPCRTPGCPKLLPATCWCREHLYECGDHEQIECQHPAHVCDSPDHYCEKHR